MRLAAAHLTITAVVAAAGSGCWGREAVVHRDEPRPYDGTPAQFAADLEALVRDLRPAPAGAVEDQARVKQACVRLDGLRDTFQYDIPSRKRAGVSDGEFILLYGAANDCTDDPETARVTIKHILTHRALRSATDTGTPASR